MKSFTLVATQVRYFTAQILAETEEEAKNILADALSDGEILEDDHSISMEDQNITISLLDEDDLERLKEREEDE